MPHDLLIENEVQKVLDELWSEQLIPFQLNVGKITKDPGGFTIHFYDSRIYTAYVPKTDPELLRDAVRSVVLDRVTMMSGPLREPDS